MKSYCHIDFSTRRRKRFIQTLFYSSSKVRNSNILMLCGPDLASHVHDFRIVNPGAQSVKLNIYELNHKTYLKNINDAKNYNGIRFNIVNNNIRNAKIRRFVDLDFCSVLNNSFDIVEEMYNKMLNILPYKGKILNKHILVTFSLRNKQGIILDEPIQKLCDLFGISNEFEKLDSFPKLNIMKHKNKDCMYSAYRDGSPMCTFSFQFK